MSRVAKKPITLPKGVEFNAGGDSFIVKGPKGNLSLAKPAGVNAKVENGVLQLEAATAEAVAITGTTRAILANMVHKDINLSLGFSHPVVFKAPEGITLATPTQTEIHVTGADKQRVGEVAAKIRGFRSPEPYKGKGVRYSGETIVMKEAKKA
jgi:large subunit ribosomal protein L6